MPGEATIDGAALDAEIYAVGRRLAERSRGQPLKAPVRALDDRAMQLASRDRELRAALFRLVDVTPACRSLDVLGVKEHHFLQGPVDVDMDTGLDAAGAEQVRRIMEEVGPDTVFPLASCS